MRDGFDKLVRSAGGEHGFTLTEVLVVCLILTVVLSAIYGIFDQSLRIFSVGNNKLEAVETARVGMEKMEREIRAAYPVDRVEGKRHVFFIAGASSVPASPYPSSITFGNDLPFGASTPDRKVDVTEEITYEIRDRTNLNNSCPDSGIGGKCMLVRRQGATSSFQPVVDRVVPGGLSMSYFSGFDALGSPVAATASNGADVRFVRVSLTVDVNGKSKSLTTDVDLRNR